MNLSYHLCKSYFNQLKMNCYTTRARARTRVCMCNNSFYIINLRDSYLSKFLGIVNTCICESNRDLMRSNKLPIKLLKAHDIKSPRHFRSKFSNVRKINHNFL